MITTRGLPERGLASWMYWATTSLPVPDSPEISTAESTTATVAAVDRAARMAGLSAMTAEPFTGGEARRPLMEETDSAWVAW